MLINPETSEKNPVKPARTRRTKTAMKMKLRATSGFCISLQKVMTVPATSYSVSGRSPR